MTQLLVIGEKRSGTTFLANLLNSQDGIELYADTYRSLFDNARKLKIDSIEASLPDRKVNVLRSNLIAEGPRIGKNLDFLKNENLTSWFDLFSLALDTLKSDDTQVVGIKTTSVRSLNSQLLQKGVKIIYLLRDPRDTIISSKNRFADFNLFKYFKKWNSGYQHAKSLSANPDFLLLKYEELIGNKEITSKKLEDFLGVKINVNLEKLKIRNDGNYTDNSSFTDVNKLFDSNALYRWKTQLKSKEVIFITNKLRDTLHSLSYQTEGVSHSGMFNLNLRYSIFLLKNAMIQQLKNLLQ